MSTHKIYVLCIFSFQKKNVFISQLKKISLAITWKLNAILVSLPNFSMHQTPSLSCGFLKLCLLLQAELHVLSMVNNSLFGKRLTKRLILCDGTFIQSFGNQWTTVLISWEDLQLDYLTENHSVRVRVQ